MTRNIVEEKKRKQASPARSQQRSECPVGLERLSNRSRTLATDIVVAKPVQWRKHLEDMGDT
jgi:hypothetical protein